MMLFDNPWKGRAQQLQTDLREADRKYRSLIYGLTAMWYTMESEADKKRVMDIVIKANGGGV